MMGRVLTSGRRKKIQWQIQRMGLDQIIRDFVIDLSPFTLPPNKPTNLEDEEEQMVEMDLR